MQLTGRANYTRAGRELDLNLVDHPELAETASVAVDTACLYWSDHHLNKLADLDDIQAITRRVNGKRMLGLKARTAYLVKAKALLGAGGVPRTVSSSGLAVQQGDTVRSDRPGLEAVRLAAFVIVRRFSFEPTSTIARMAGTSSPPRSVRA